MLKSTALDDTTYDQDFTSMEGSMVNKTSPIKHLFLVGGFAESSILQEAIRKEFGRTMRVVIPQVIKVGRWDQN